MTHPQAGGSYRRDRNGKLTPIGKINEQPASPPAAPEPTPIEDETAQANPAPRKGK